MGTKYSSQTVSGYNSTPPVDDGTVSEANKVKWSTIKTKLSDPLNSFASSIDSALTTHFNNGPVALTTNTTLGASHYQQLIQVSGSGVTLSLSDANTLTAGWNCEIHSTDSSNDVAIARATASDTINSLSNNFVLLPLQSVKVFVNASANGFIIRDLVNAQSTDAGAGVGPKLTLYRNSASPAANDVLGGYYFDGEDSAGNRETYARIYAQIDDPGSTTEDGSLSIDVMKAGALTKALTITQTALNLSSGWEFLINGTSPFTAANGASFVTITSQTASSSATLDFTTTVDWTLYDIYEFDFINILPATNGAQLEGLVTKDAGSNWEAGASDYAININASTTAGTDTVKTNGVTRMIFTDDVNGVLNSAGNGINGKITLYAPNVASKVKQFISYISYWDSASNYASADGSNCFYDGAALGTGAAAINGVRFRFHSGNIASGTIRVRGIKNS